MVIGANADDNFDWQINDAEAAGNQMVNPFANIAYNWLRDIAQVKVNHKLVEDIYEDFSYYDTEIEYIDTETPQRNDTNVTVNSARAMPGARLELYARGINHGTIIGPSMQYQVIEAGLTGGLNWEKE